MSHSERAGVTRLLHQVADGDRAAFDEMIPLVYRELHDIAERQRRRWEGNETLNTTALVHEAYLRLVDVPSGGWRGRPHFLAVAATAMRQILFDYAKRARAVKRGGGRAAVPLEDAEAALGVADPANLRSDVLIALEEALRRLEAEDPRQSRIVECRFFGGMTIPDTAEALGISPATVKRGWVMAQAWLYRELQGEPEGTP